MPNRTTLCAALAAAALLASGDRASARNYGRETEPHEVVTTTIAPAGDTDEFLFPAAAGFKVTVTAKRAKGSDLAPVLELVSPSGAAVVDGVKAAAGKSSAKLTATLLEDGLYAYRLKGASGTGACTVKWKLAPAKVPAVKNLPMAGNEVLSFDVPARGGALLSWTLKWKGDGAAQVKQILDPDGAEVPFDPNDETYITRGLSSEKAKLLPLPANRPGGVYSLVVENDLFPSTVNLSVKVALPKLPAAAVGLTPYEPALDAIDRQSGTCWTPAVLTGSHLSESPRGVLFGSRGATSVFVTDGDPDVADDGASVSCRVPAGSGTVDIVYVNADGQVAVLPAAFTFDPAPVISSFDPAIGPGQGGVDLTLFGSGFQTEVPDIYEVLVGGVPASQVRVIDANTIACKTPAHVAGPKPVVLRDKCGEEVTAPGTFTYGTGLFITTVRPGAIPVFGGVAVTISGSNFSATDQVLLDGVPVATTPVLYGTTVIAHLIAAAEVPAHAPGKVDVKVQSQGGASATKIGGLEYFTFSDATATAIPAATSTDDWGGVSNALIDKDSDGKVDYILVAHAAALSGTRPGTRILRNGGTGVFTDVTSTAMPALDNENDWSAALLLTGRLNSDVSPDVFMVKPGTGIAYDQDGDGTPDWIEARMKDSKTLFPWSRVLLPDADGKFVAPPVYGPEGILGLTGMRFCNSTWACAGEKRPDICMLYNFDFRGVGGAMGDLDGDLDGDVVLVNDSSLATFSGLAAGIWVGCYYGLVNYQYYSAVGYGSALRILSSGSNGGLTDRTKELLETLPTPSEDFRAVAAAVADMDGDFLNDLLITHNEGMTKGAQRIAVTRYFRQRNSGSSVLYKQNTVFLPAPATATDDDWRGDAVAAADLDNDFYRDIVVCLDDVLPGGGAFSTRILIQNPAAGKVENRTSAILTGVLPAGDDARARAILARDIDRDGDIDLILSTPDSLGANRRTRFLLNLGRDATSGLPVYLDASSLFPAAAADPGNAVAIALGDVNGDGHLDLVLTDTHLTSGTPVKRTRVWVQVR